MRKTSLLPSPNKIDFYFFGKYVTRINNDFQEEEKKKGEDEFSLIILDMLNEGRIMCLFNLFVLPLRYLEE